MLCWFARRDVAEAALHGDRMLKASDIKRNPKTAACLDSNVCLKAIQKYCETPAWHAVERIAEDLQKEGLWRDSSAHAQLNSRKINGAKSGYGNRKNIHVHVLNLGGYMWSFSWLAQFVAKKGSVNIGSCHGDARVEIQEQGNCNIGDNDIVMLRGGTY
ncbi:hypothetical protein LSAT2_010370 [Lamellibrachia satsuma]|nr:hypothetical protein LSAT2_010370 [Lamellibrachia satsuma]